jgi:hypothetical protein
MERVAGLEQMLKRRSKPQAFVERLPGTKKASSTAMGIIELFDETSYPT